MVGLLPVVPEANRFLREVYLDKHNVKFAVAPKRATDLHRSLTGYALSQIFCVREERTLRNDFTIQYQRRLFQLDPRQPTILRPGDAVAVSEGLDGTLAVGIRNVDLRFHEIAERPLKAEPEKVPCPRPPRVPPANHPWRRYAQADISIVRNSRTFLLSFDRGLANCAVRLRS